MHISEPYCLNLPEICRRFFISESQLRRNFVQTVGMPPSDYIRLRRLELAASMLESGSRSIKEVADSCGFSTPYYLTKCFHDHFGVPPTKYHHHNI